MAISSGDYPLKRRIAMTPSDQSKPICLAERDQIIRRTAYAFYEARGHIDGHELEDWMKAEAQFPLAPPGSPQAGTSSSTSH